MYFVLKSSPFGEDLGEVVLIPVMIRLERPVHMDADVLSLFRFQFFQLRADMCEVQIGYLLIEVLRRYVNFVFVFAVVVPEFYLSKCLVRE